MASGKEKISRENILVAGAEVFCEMAFHEVSMEMIAKRAGSTKAAIYRNFSSKEALFIELIQRSTYSQAPAMMDLLRKTGVIYEGGPLSETVGLADISDPNYSLKEELMKVGEHILNSFHTSQALAVQRMVIAATINSDAGYTFYKYGPAKAIENLSIFFSVHMSVGILRRTDARVAAFHYYGLLQSEIYQVGIFNVFTSIQPSITKIIVARAVDIFLKGYEKESEVIQRANHH